MTRPKKQSKTSLLQSPKGMRDILPADQPVWEKMRRAVREVTDFYNFERLDTPIAEAADLFERAVGADTDVVEKQMFYLEGKSGGKRFALRPEGTAPVARAYIEHGMSHWGLPLKLYYEGSFFRHEQPQAGRWRELHQAGFEIIAGDNDPIYDAQVVLVGCRFFGELRIRDITVAINTIGCRNCRPSYRRALIDFYKEEKKSLCADCLRRLSSNPLRLLDCKNDGCRTPRSRAPIMIDHICVPCSSHFKNVLEYLEELKLPYALDHYLVRGFDYYSRTVFEYVIEGVDYSLGGGGRYDYLIEQLGGKSAPAVGAALGLDRIAELIKSRNINCVSRTKAKVFLIYIGDLAKKKSLSLIERLREAGIGVTESLGRESLKAQLRAADKKQSSLALIFGQKEAFEDTVIIRDMTSGVQEPVPIAKMAEMIKKRLR